jgi:hypothetical protein
MHGRPEPDRAAIGEVETAGSGGGITYLAGACCGETRHENEEFRRQSDAKDAVARGEAERVEEHPEEEGEIWVAVKHRVEEGPSRALPFRELGNLAVRESFPTRSAFRSPIKRGV